MKNYKTLKFKTTLNCGNCVAKVQQKLDELLGAGQWKVDTDNPDKILTVTTEAEKEDDVIDIVESAGFDIDTVDA
ncbi:hypothetical protein BCY91_05750 [Pelobium manganitolerans]|uniref:HMA domain-containing protein n=1 Tax=Pelobium manganitolerans TaxID=1842495 RepID=A0A419S4I2_9SPHI|nr:heavy metal-associated domain-containing protein [Pelobium manganitolerans]RKD15032.1 hypothetical protein BCY91_05750 [Pelobium manganitolerans]